MKKAILSLILLLWYSLTCTMDQEELNTIGILIQKNNAGGENILHDAVKKYKKLSQYQKELTTEADRPERKKTIEARFKKKFEVGGTSNLEEYSQFVHKNIILLIQNLKDTGFDFNAYTFNGNTALSLAINYRAAKVVDVLLEADANSIMCNRDGLTPLYIACQQKNTGIILESLLTKDAHIETLPVPVSEDVSTLRIQAALHLSLPNAVAITAHLKSFSPQKQQPIIASTLHRRHIVEATRAHQEKKEQDKKANMKRRFKTALLMLRSVVP